MEVDADAGVESGTADSAADEPRWTLLGFDEITGAYWNHVAPDIRDDGRDPETHRPTHSWLQTNGHGKLVYALRKYHDRSFGEFWAEDLGLSDSGDGYDWPTDDDRTVEAAESWLASRADRSGLKDSAVTTLRYRLARYMTAYVSVTGHDDLLGPVEPDSDVPAAEATERAWKAFDQLDDILAPSTTSRIHGAAREWYDHLKRRRRVALNPVDGLEDEYRWERQQSDDSTPSLESGHVRSLYEAASTTSDQLLVIAVCAWGLREKEVAALHSDQLAFDTPDEDGLTITFEERKNGPSAVTAVYGASVVRERLADLDTVPDDVPGPEQDAETYLFPSSRSASGHICRTTVYNRFRELAEGADLPDTIDGARPSPQLGRRWWYDAWAAAQEQVLEVVDEIADKQGSDSAEVVLSNYLSDERERKLRRRSMRERLTGAFRTES